MNDLIQKLIKQKKEEGEFLDKITLIAEIIVSARRLSKSNLLTENLIKDIKERILFLIDEILVTPPEKL